MKKAKVLTIEDEQDLREAIVTSLTNAGFEAIEAADGAIGVEMALKHHPDVILMDIIMPNLDGHEATEKIREDVWGKDAKIIFLSALSDAENVVHAVKNGSEEYIIKPHTSLQEIVSKVQEVLYASQN